jgi:hypothetical protein
MNNDNEKIVLRGGGSDQARNEPAQVQLKNFAVYIRSHSAMPDYENEIQASSKEEAIKILLQEPALAEWDKETLAPYVEEV